MLENIFMVIGMLIMGCILFVILVPLSQVFRKLSKVFAFGLDERLAEWLKPGEKGAFRSGKGLITLGASLGLTAVVAIVLLLMGKNGNELLDIFVENTILGAMAEMMADFNGILSAGALVSVGVSTFVCDLLAKQFDDEKWYIKILIAPVLILGAAALAVVLRVPFGWLAALGEVLILPLFQEWEGQTFLNVLRLIPAIIVGLIALVLIPTTIYEYISVFAATMMGLALVAVIVLIPSFFGFAIPDTMSSGAFVVMILGIEVLKMYMEGIYGFLSDKIQFLPNVDFD